MKIIQESLLSDSNAFIRGYVRDGDAASQHYKYPAIIIVPGGSFTHISPQQAESFAIAFEAAGYQSFYLRYSFDYEKHPLYPYPLVELGKSIDLIKTRANEFNIDPQRIVIAGFSIGGHIVSLFNNFYDQTTLIQQVQPQNSLKPMATILSYPVIDLKLGFPKDQQTIDNWVNQTNQIAAQDGVTDTNVPTFIWHTTDDPFVPSINALKYAEALNQHHIDNEIHLFHHGPHGMALANNLTAWNDESNDPHVAKWFQLAIEWLKEIEPTK